VAGTSQIPRLVKHMTMAILRKGKIHSIDDAFEIARAQLTKYGYLDRGSDRGPVSNIKLTSAGKRKNREHARRPMRAVLEFDRLFAKSRLAVDLDEGPSGLPRE
jgi:predicted metalloprotease